MTYPETLELGVALADYFRRSGLGEDGGYSARWVHFQIGPVRFAIPNTQARRDALLLHDLHHIATEYNSSWAGEAEISAWELARGCGRYSAAWFLDLVAFQIGLIIAPRRTWQAFRHGRNSDNLYRETWNPEWLGRTVGDLRAQLGVLRAYGPVCVGDMLLFAFYALPFFASVLLAVGALQAILQWASQ